MANLMLSPLHHAAINPNVFLLYIVMEEIPQTGPGQLHSLSHHDTRHEAVSKVLTSPDSMLVSQIVDAFATNSSEHMYAVMLFIINME